MSVFDKANEELTAITMELQKLVPELDKLESNYYYMYNKYLLTSQLKTATDREAEAKVRLYDEGISEPYKELISTVMILRQRREVIIEICKNMRASMAKVTN